MWEALRKMWQTYDDPQRAILARIGQIERECKSPTKPRDEIPLASRELGDSLGLLIQHLSPSQRGSLVADWSHDPYDRCRTVIAHAMAWVRGAEALPVLQQLTDDRCEETRLAARKSADLRGRAPTLRDRPRRPDPRRLRRAAASK